MVLTLECSLASWRKGGRRYTYYNALLVHSLTSESYLLFKTPNEGTSFCSLLFSRGHSPINHSWVDQCWKHISNWANQVLPPSLEFGIRTLLALQTDVVQSRGLHRHFLQRTVMCFWPITCTAAEKIKDTMASERWREWLWFLFSSFWLEFLVKSTCVPASASLDTTVSGFLLITTNVVKLCGRKSHWSSWYLLAVKVIHHWLPFSFSF